MKEKKKDLLAELKTKKKVQEYQSVRIRQEIYNQYQEIADQEGITFPGKIIHLALEKWLNEYKKEKEKNF